MSITNIVQTDLGGGMVRVSFDVSDVTASPIEVHYGPTAAYGNTQISTRVGPVEFQSDFSPSVSPFHYEVQVGAEFEGDFIGTFVPAGFSSITVTQLSEGRVEISYTHDNDSPTSQILKWGRDTNYGNNVTGVTQISQFVWKFDPITPGVSPFHFEIEHT